MPKCKECKNSYGFMELTAGRCKSCINQATPPCNGCHKNFYEKELTDGYCAVCLPIQMEKQATRKAESEQKKLLERRQINKDKALNDIILTTETAVSFEIEKRIDIITAECVLGMNVFRDMFAGVRDIIGGRSSATQKVLKDAKNIVLSELRQQGLELGANAVIAIDLDYSEFSGGGKSMLFVVATGTAVRANIR